MIGAIEFLKKAKAINDIKAKEKIGYAIIDCLYGNEDVDESELVRKVMTCDINEAQSEKYKEHEKDCPSCKHKDVNFTKQEPCLSCLEDWKNKKILSGWEYDEAEEDTDAEGN